MSIKSNILRLFERLFPTGRAWYSQRNVKLNATYRVKTGLLYNRQAAQSAICTIPDFGVPSTSEYTTLSTFLGGDTVAGEKLKSVSGWFNSGNGTDDYGWNGKPLAARNDDGSYELNPNYAVVYRATASGLSVGRRLVFIDNSFDATSIGANVGYPMRMVYTGTGTPDSKVYDADGNEYDVIEIGTQYWTVQNYAGTSLLGGGSVPIVQDDTEWANTTGAACCLPKDGESDIYTDEIISKIGIDDTDKFIAGRMKAYERFESDMIGVLDQVLPDNDNFTIEDIENWERVYGIDNSDLSESERKNILYARMSYPNGEIYRTTQYFMQKSLRDAGFDVYVHENRSWGGSEFMSTNPVPSVYGGIKYGEAVYGNSGVSYKTILSNYVDESIDDNNQPLYGERENNLFFIGGETYPDPAIVPISRYDEFRALVLRLKPAQTSAVLGLEISNVNYGYLYDKYAVELTGFSTITDFDIPTEAQVDVLTLFAGDSISGRNLKSKTGWDYGNGVDLYGYRSLPNGYRGGNGTFNELGTASTVAIQGTKILIMGASYDYAGKLTEALKFGSGVRMIYNGSGVPPKTVTDYDGNVYDVIRIGTQYWLKQNYACTHLSDGTPIAKITDNTDWANDTGGAYCAYNNDETNVFK